MSTTNDNFHGTSERLDVSPAAKDIDEPTEEEAAKSTLKRTTTTTTCKESSLNDDNQCCAQVVLCRRFKDSTGLFRNFNSLPLFVYATSQSTHAISADGVGVSREAAASVIGVAVEKNDIDDLIRCSANATKHCNSDGVSCVIINAMECLPLGGNNAGGTTGLIGSTHAHNLMLPSINGGNSTVVNGANVTNGNHATTTTTTTTYQHHLNLNHPLNHQHQHHHLLMSHHSATTPYSNNYPLQHSSSSHHHIHSDQTKSLQELQHEVGALLEFRDLVIETFPDLKNKMVSMSSSTSATSSGATGGVGGNSGGGSGGGGSNSVNGQSVSGTNTLTGGISSSSLASRREWEPGIRTKRKSSQKEQPTNVTSSTTGSSNNVLATNNAAAGAGELSSSSLTRSRSNSHSGKKEPKSGGENNGSVVQDSGFSTETSSSKEGHSASSTNGAMTGPNATNRLSCHETDDELLNLLDVIHRKSNRLREEVEQLQNYERTQLHGGSGGGGGGEIEETDHHTTSTVSTATTAITTKSCTGSSGLSGLTPKTFREHVERLNKEDIKQLRKERDRLLDKLAEMEAETLTGRIKAAKMNDQVEELMSVKKDLEEQLKLAMAQKLELSSRVQQLQQQQQHQQQAQQSKSSSSQSEYSSQRNFSSSATTVLSTVDSGALLQQQQRRQNTFQPVVVIPSQCDETSSSSSNAQNAFRQSATGSDISNKHEQQQFATQPLGRLDGIVSSPGTRNSKCRDPIDSKRFAAILLETSVIELQRQLLRLTVQNQALSQKLEQSTKSKSNLVKRLDKSKEDVDDLRFQLEEKCIELEGTKAQLRVLESRIHSSTSHSTATTNSTPSYLLHSQNDYETNRSSASTTLMLSRRGIGNDSTSHSSDAHRSSTPSTAIAMPPPTSTQISTPSMKAMTHLPIDEMQQHSSSTESAHDNDLPSGEERAASRLIMSTSVGGGGISAGSFEKRDLNATRRYLTSTKPSKIPLPGSKTMSYFGGKPPSGRPSTTISNNTSHHNSGRSPNSSTTNMSSGSSRSSLSRSTGNLLYSKSPNSLKRADSAQSITKAINISNLSSGNVTIPSTTRILQNSPLPKPKRDSITSRLRNIESVSRSTQQHQQNDSHNTTPNTTPRGGAKTPPSSNLVTSTPKSGAIASQLNSTLRKDLQLNSSNISHGSQQFLRRATGGGAVSTTTPTTTTTTTTNHNTSVTRRFSSASTVGIRAARNQQEQNGVNCGGHEHANSVNSGVNSDSDSGKHLISSYNKRVACNTMKIALTYNKETTKAPAAPYTIPHRLNYSNSNTQTVVAPIFHDCINPYFTIYANKKCDLISNSLTGISTVYEQQNEFDEEICTTPIMNDVVNSLTSMEQGSDNLLVTFDYGYSDSFDNLNSMERDFDMSSKKFINMEDCFYDLQHDKNTETESIHLKANESLNEINEYESNLSEDMWYAIQRPQSQDSVENMAKAFQVHHMEYDDVLRNENGESILSINSSLPEYDVDDNDDGDDDDGEDDDGDGDDYINYNEHNYGNDNRDIEREKKLWQNYQEPCKYETDLEEEFYDSIECS